MDVISLKEIFMDSTVAMGTETGMSNKLLV